MGAIPLAREAMLPEERGEADDLRLAETIGEKTERDTGDCEHNKQHGLQ